jgi:hypothetical protein
MKLMIATLLLPLTTLAAEPLITCQMSDLKACQDCGKRIPVSCEDHGFVGSMETSIKPQKIQWKISNSKTGTEKWISSDNKTLSLKDLQNAKDLKAVALKQKVSVAAGETVTLAGIQVKGGTALFKAQSGKEILAKMKPMTQQRAIASDTTTPHAGGVGRAQKMKDQK